MSLIHWMPENNTNIDFVDNQHRNIASLINELERALEGSLNTVETQRIIKKILNSAISHFAQEENLMEQHDVPDLQTHENEHYFFEDTVCAVEDALKANDISLAREKLLILSEWFVDHIREMDQESLQYVKN
ncbi:MAG: bacteriohemerythrin [Desulfocapsaceae bacterium]|nr:bacteriohemerythrin [Desulfocapsaceae bacterium]